MDSLTQAVLGATIQGVGMGRYQGRKALLYGAMLGTLPDLDVLIRYADPVSAMTYHRGFTHSLFVLPLLALVLAWLIKKRWPHSAYGFGRLYATLCLALVTHPLLDAFTVYGTQLWWPLTPTPQQWSGVFIIDPLYTLPMLAACVYALATRISAAAQKALAATLLWGCIYLAWGTYGQYHHQQRVQAALAQQGIAVKRIMATPMPLNTILYRVVAETDNGEYIDAVSGWLDQTPPEFIRQPQGLALAAPLQHDALYQRLAWFSDGWLRVDDINGQLVVTDLRMGVPGRHNFRFVMAEKKTNGHWHTVTPYRHEDDLGDLGQSLALLWQRIFDSRQSLPLASWALSGDGRQASDNGRQVTGD